MPTSTPYLDFEIEIGPGDGVTYPVTVLRSPAGEAKAELTWPFSELELKNRLLALENSLLRSGGKRRKQLSPDEVAVQAFGQELFDMLFVGDVRTTFYESRTKTHETGLRIKLRIQDPGMAALPWEFLYDPRRSEYLCFSRHTPLVRYLALTRPIPPLAVAAPLRILGMVASPAGMAELDVAVEKERVERGLAELRAQGLVELTWLPGQGWRDLQRAMRQGPWHIFHFIGHGGFDEQRGEGLIVLADSQGRPEPLNATELARLLTNHRSLRLALFNSCDGARSDRLDIFSSTAATLVQAGLPAVLAMQHEITDQAASEFAGGFYEALADNLPVDSAVAEARLTMSLGVRNSLEWGTPVLFMRSPDGVIFDLVDMSASEKRPPDEKIPEKNKSVTIPVQVVDTTVLLPADSPLVEIPVDLSAGPVEVVVWGGPIDFDWVEIPAGEFIMGSKSGEGLDDDERPQHDEKPQHTVYLPEYWIAAVPVTNAQYKMFVDATGHLAPTHWTKGQIPDKKADHPVVNVSWNDAQAFCNWAGVKLPTEAQWEKAARGTDGRLWPWGNKEPTKDYCNFNGNDTTPVGAYPKGASPYGCLDMAGNVWEWTSSQSKSYPYDEEDGREDVESSAVRVLRGGAFAYDVDDVRCANRLSHFLDYRRRYYGFRVVSPGF